MKRLFKPPVAMLATVLPYLFLSFFLYYNTEFLAFLPAFLTLSCAGFAFYWFYDRKAAPSGRKRYAIMSGITAFILIAALIIIDLLVSIWQDGALLTFLITASVPVLYNVCGIAAATEHRSKKSVLAYIVGLLLIPFTSYLLFSLSVGANLRSMFLIVFICGVFASFFMLASIAITSYRNRKTENTEEPANSKNFYILTFMLGLFLPVTGLLLNYSLNLEGGIFGDFSSPAFYIIAIINGALLMLPPTDNVNIRLLLFFLRAAGYTYILYFFVVFLPVMPIGILALVVLIGAYAFSPALIAFWQGRILYKDFVFLKSHVNVLLVVLVLAAGLITLPVSLFAAVTNDRQNLEKAAQYLESLPPEEYQEVDLWALERSLDQIDAASTFTVMRMGMLETGYKKGSIPILSNIYKTYVLHGQAISGDNVRALRNIFFDRQSDSADGMSQLRPAGPSPVTLSGASVDTVFDESMQAYRSMVNLELKNPGDGREEYATTFTLPEGAYISDYYLYVFDKKKTGILADERAAIFIYNKIVARSLDPGILHYIGENTLELRVFPFESHELRKTGFEIIHRQGFDFTIDGKTIVVEGGEFPDFEVPGAILLGAESIKKLPALDRKPQYNFVIDCSNNSNVEVLVKETQDYIAQTGISDAAVYFASYRVERDDNPDTAKTDRRGGFNLSLAVKMIFDDTPQDKFPVIIAVTENMPAAVFPEATKVTPYPESPYYYSLNYNFTLTPYAFSNNEKQENVRTPEIKGAVSYNGIAVGLDEQCALIKLDGAQTELTANQYENAVMLRADMLYGSGGSSNDIRRSFRANVLTSDTAFIVVETEEQEKEMLDMQEQLLNGLYNEPESTQQLSEPSVFVLIGLLALVFAVIKLRRRSPV